MNADFRFTEISGPDLGPWIDSLGELRIRVFREFPYLYDGTLEYERDYLSTYQTCADSRITLVHLPDGPLIGATTCLPLGEETEEFRRPFIDAGLDPSGFLYFGESIVLPEWRGCGLGSEFFRRREAHAHFLGLHSATFCAVDRPEDHPLRPADYRPLDGFWNSRGFQKRPELQARFPWKEIGEDQETIKTLTFWTKSWNH